MSSRRRGANTGNPSSEPTRTYELRHRTKNVQQSETDPQILEPEKKNRTEDVKKKPAKRSLNSVEPETEFSSEDDGSDDGNSSGSASFENDKQSYSLQSISISKNDLSSPLVRPSIHSAADNDEKEPRSLRPREGSTSKQSSTYKQVPDLTKGSAIKQSSTTRQTYNYMKDDEEKSTNYKEKTWRDQLNVMTGYREEKETWSGKDRAEQSFLHYRNQHIPTGNQKSQIFQSRAHVGFSDDEEVITPLQQKRASQPRLLVRDEINHYPEKSVEQKANTVQKPPTKSFIHIVGTCMKYLVLTFLVLLFGTMVVFYISPMSLLRMAGQMQLIDGPQVKKDLTDDFENLKSVFTNQSQLMWKRSKRILELHLENWKENPEPAIILLTGDLDAEQTLLCLGTRLANMYSSSLNGSSLVISGSDWKSGSNEEVKEYIDNRLTEGFQTTTRAAVLHRLELLPAGSLLILYKYCDHESSVFKDVTLLFTVLLDDAPLAKDISFTDLEEKVREFLIQKLIESNPASSHDGMDKDKFSGVWSRISHVVLPVFPEKNMGECMKEN